MKLYIDDMRNPPVGWVLARTYNEAIELIPFASEISFDHDLGEEKTGYDLIKIIEENYFVKGITPPIMHCHSANPVGRKNIETVIERLRN